MNTTTYLAGLIGVIGVIAAAVLGFLVIGIVAPNPRSVPEQTVIIVTPTPLYSEEVVRGTPFPESDLTRIKGDVVWFISYDDEETTVYRWFELRLQMACVQTYHKNLSPEYRWDGPACIPVKDLPEDIQSDVAALTLRWKGILP